MAGFARASRGNSPAESRFSVCHVLVFVAIIAGFEARSIFGQHSGTLLMRAENRRIGPDFA
jgi:hypothetical protein